MQKAQVLSHAVELYVSACESFSDSSAEDKEKVSSCMDLCKSINSQVAEAFSKNSLLEQLEHLDKALKSGKDFRNILSEIEETEMFTKELIFPLQEMSLRTDKEIKQIVQFL